MVWLVVFNQWLVDFLVVVLDKDGDLLLNQVGLLLDHWNNLVDWVWLGDWDVFIDGHQVGSGNLDWDWHRVRFRDGHGFGYVHDVGLGYLDWDWDRVRLGYWEGLGHWNWSQDGVGGEDVLDDGHDDVFWYKLGHWKRFVDWVRPRNGHLLVHWIWLWNGNVLRDVLHNYLHGSSVLDVSPRLRFMAVAMTSGSDQGRPQKAS